MVACSFARFVIHYKDGSTLMEDRNDEYCWDNAPKFIKRLVAEKDSKGNEIEVEKTFHISALGIQFDPVQLFDPETKKAIRDESGIPTRVVFPEHVLRASSKYRYKYFQYKDTLTVTAEVGSFKRGKNELGVVIGMILDKAGHCIVMQGTPARAIKTFYTTIRSLGLSHDLFKVKLEELPENVIG